MWNGFPEEEYTINSIQCFLQNKQEELEKIGRVFQVAIHFPPSYLQPKMIDTSFCALVGLP